MRTFKNTFVLLLVALMIISASSIALAGTNNKKTSILSIEDGEEIALFYTIDLSNTISELADWNGASVEHEITYYDFDGDITAYAYDVIKNDEYQGFILISATKDNYPILEFSKGKLPQMSSEKEEISQKLVTQFATENSLSMNTDESIPVYGGATFYYTEYKMTSKKDKTEKKIYVDLYTQEILDLSDVNTSKENTNFDSSSKKQDIQASWTDLESRMSENTASSAVTTSSLGYIYGVPYENANVAGCSPAAGAMVLGYWDANGYSSFPSGDTLIDELADAMGTVNYATDIEDVDDGIEEVCRDHNYNFDAQNEGSFDIYDIVDEIDESRPFVINMHEGLVGSGNTNPYGNHSVTCIGYSHSVTDYLFLHDGWDLENHHYITFGSWEWAVVTWVRP
ncbi:MAG: hypothetical protein PWQ63_1815 [Methanolobus sp.]|jgi:hypothetical protein|nr:hypothetical protein [Methanolobus sp.]MDK2948655.1 hypothetical protein [Methanolobus sp.]